MGPMRSMGTLGPTSLVISLVGMSAHVRRCVPLLLPLLLLPTLSLYNHYHSFMMLTIIIISSIIIVTIIFIIIINITIIITILGNWNPQCHHCLLLLGQSGWMLIRLTDAFLYALATCVFEYFETLI